MKLRKLRISKKNVLELADSMEEIPSNRTNEIAGGVWETGRGPCADMPTTRCNTETGEPEPEERDTGPLWSIVICPNPYNTIYNC